MRGIRTILEKCCQQNAESAGQRDSERCRNEAGEERALHRAREAERALWRSRAKKAQMQATKSEQPPKTSATIDTLSSVADVKPIGKYEREQS